MSAALPSVPPVSEVNPAGLVLPSDGKVPTAQDALNLALTWAKWTGATRPQLVELKLETLKAAMDETDQRTNQPVGSSMAAFQKADPGKPVWRVVFGGDTLLTPRCPPTDAMSTPVACPTTRSVQFVTNPVTGGALRKTFGIATPAS